MGIVHRTFQECERVEVSERTEDRELVMLATALERLACRVRQELDADSSEASSPGGGDLLIYAQTCLEVLDDPRVAQRLSLSM